MASTIVAPAERALAGRPLQQLFEDLKSVSIAVVGDFCLDVYWSIDPAAREPSVETGLPTWPVAAQRVALGGAGTIVNNLVALGVGRVDVHGVVGDDLWGREMLRLLAAAGVGAAGVLTEPTDWATLVYVKPCLGEEEMNRLDFGNFNRLSDDAAERLLAGLEASLARYDAVIVNQQVRQGVHTPALRERLLGLIRRNPSKIFIVDSRHHSDAYPGATLKLNAHEAVRRIGIERPLEQPVPRADAARAAEELHEWTLRQPVVITRGARGCLVRDQAGLHEIPGLRIPGPLDPVGAGDALLAGLGAALAAGRDPLTAATLGNFAAAVTVRKRLTTGTASAAEIIALSAEAEFVYRPELADDPSLARLLPGTEIELVGEPRPALRPRFALFDHDGTLSVLREGWETVMESMMVRAILGQESEGSDAADDALRRRALERVREYIDHSAGIQTLVQMRELAAMVREFGCVAPARILDAFGYKRLYNDLLMEPVSARLEKLRRGERAAEDFTIKNAIPFLGRLKAAGVRLFLASGTDEADVRQEARELGYEPFFDGIFGAVGDVAREAKLIALDRIVAELGGETPGAWVTFGDGPLEMRETHKRGGFAIGVASDELRRYGTAADKRARLIRAGADLIIPDYAQSDRLLEILNLA